MNAVIIKKALAVGRVMRINQLSCRGQEPMDQQQLFHAPEQHGLQFDRIRPSKIVNFRHVLAGQMVVEVARALTVTEVRLVCCGANRKQVQIFAG